MPAGWLAPLGRFYAKSGLGLPEVEPVSRERLPEPARTLLAHDVDMTSTLRAFHGAGIGLRVCAVEETEDGIGRLVVLFREDSGRPVEFGAIFIRLGVLPDDVRDRVVAGREPLGAVLESCGVAFRSAPRGFFRFHADPFIGVLLEQEIRKPLFGRCNVLSTADGTDFAEIVEILPEERATAG